MIKHLTRRGFLGSALAASSVGLYPFTGPFSGGAFAMANPAVADDVLRALRAFIDTLSAAGARATLRRFSDRARLSWHYTPRRRPGLRLDRMSAAQKRALWDLLASLLSPRGMAQVEGVIKLERVLGELTDNLSYRDPDNYAIVVFGDVAKADPILLRFEGHHLSLTALLVPAVGVSVTPAFFGANPATVPSRHRHAGFRLLGPEEDTAFGLVRSLAGGARTRAIIADRSLGDVVAGPGRETSLKSFEGVALSDLSEGQSAGVYRILELFTTTMRPEIAQGAIARVRSDGADALHFAWAGSLQPGRPHYFRIHGPSVLVEYDNTQAGANHVHALWLDPREVFGRDLLRSHHDRSH